MELPLLSVSFTPWLELFSTHISFKVLNYILLRSVGTKITDLGKELKHQIKFTSFE